MSESKMSQQTIYKYPLSPGGYTEIDLPINSLPLWVQYQNGVLNVWVMVDPKTQQTDTVKIAVVGTGHEIPPKARYGWKHINTFLMQGGRLAFHAFEIKESLQ